MPHHLRRVGVAAAVLVSAGCGAGRTTSASTTLPTRVTTTTSATPSTTVPSSTTLDPFADEGQADVILAADLGSVTDFDQVATTAPLDPDSAKLARHTAGAELAFERRALSGLQAKGEMDTGALVVLSQHIKQYNGGEAVVVDCEKDAISVVTTRTHHIVSPADDDLTMVNSLVDLEPDGQWLVTLTDSIEPGCS